MSPAPDALDRMLRAADRAAQSALAPAALDRIERAVLARTGGPGGRPASGVPAWLPAASAAGAIAVLAFLLGRGDTAAPAPGRNGTLGRPALAMLAPEADGPRLDRAVLVRLGLESAGGVRRIVLADFEQPDLTGVSGALRVEFSPGGFSGGASLAAPDGEGTIVFEVPAAHRTSIVGISVWVRAAGEGTTVSLVAECEDGSEMPADAAQTTIRGAWRWALFPFPADRVRSGGGVRRLKLSFAGRSAVKMDKIELWTTAAEGRR